MLVARRIIRDASRGGEKPGTLLAAEHVMIEQYGVGRSTLREALRLLEFQGVITLKPGPGGGPVLRHPDASHLASSLMLIMQMTESPFRVLIEARAAIEPMVSRLAAERMDAESLDRLRATITGMRDNLENERDFMALNNAFHDIIAHASGNAVFSYLIDSFSGILDGTSLGLDYPLHRRKAILKAHEEIFAAIEARDPVEAQARMDEHISAYAAYAARKFAKVLGAVPDWDSALNMRI